MALISRGWAVEGRLQAQRVRYVNAGAKAAVVIADNEAVGRSRGAELRPTRCCLLWPERFTGKTGDAKLTAVSLAWPL